MVSLLCQSADSADVLFDVHAIEEGGGSRAGLVSPTWHLNISLTTILRDQSVWTDYRTYCNRSSIFVVVCSIVCLYTLIL